MYTPAEFSVADRSVLDDFIRKYPFATVLGSKGSVSHLPLLLSPDGSALHGHLARANPQLAELRDGAEVLTIFHGPHGYVSPSIYLQHPSVPTWNYAVVHVRGVARALDDAALWRLLGESVDAFESGAETPWPLDLPAEYRAEALARICGFEIRITGLEGKFKVSQNRSPEEQDRVIAHFERGDDGSRELAAFMRRVLTR